MTENGGGQGQSTDSVTDTTVTGFGDAILNSLKGMLVGIVLFIVACPVLIWNEGRAVHTASGLAEGGKVVVSVPAEAVSPTNEGRLVHLTGKADTKQVLNDGTFGITATALRLRRTVEMFQWVEHKETKEQSKLGGGKETVTTFTYSKEWSEARQESEKFRQPNGHVNPQMPARGTIVTTDAATLGAFKLPQALVAELQQFSPLALSPAQMQLVAAKLPETLRSQMQPTGDAAYFGAEPPDVGNVRISFATVSPMDVSVIGKQQGDQITPYLTRENTTIDMIQPGILGADIMFKQAQDENKALTWILRAVGLALMVVGLYLLVAPLVALANVIPFLGSIIAVGAGIAAFALGFTLSLITIAIAWIVYRPLLGIGLLVLAGAVIYGAYAWGKKRQAAPAALG